MTWWTLCNKEEGYAELVIELYKDDRKLFIRETFSSGEIGIETEDDTPPEVNLENPNGFNILDFDCENWEGGDYTDRRSYEISSPQNLSDEELQKLKIAYETNWLHAIEELGWTDAGEQQWWLYGPLELKDEDGNLID